ncbi:hypothetical protein BX600DRAFT_442947 [Xylariales sp. PMI_506]|nr:hypothetical protein BX600DRAFT_442947 [Xylariales sp. PMI_506]
MLEPYNTSNSDTWVVPCGSLSTQFKYSFGIALDISQFVSPQQTSFSPTLNITATCNPSSGNHLRTGDNVAIGLPIGLGGTVLLLIASFFFRRRWRQIYPRSQVRLNPAQSMELQEVEAESNAPSASVDKPHCTLPGYSPVERPPDYSHSG